MTLVSVDMSITGQAPLENDTIPHQTGLRSEFLQEHDDRVPVGRICALSLPIHY